MHDCLIAFGSNEGNSNQIFDACIELLREVPQIRVVSVSDPLTTDPVGGPKEQDRYLNAAIRIETKLSASDLHAELVRIETDLGRERRYRWGARKIDLDLLIHGQLQIDTEDLTIPHPRMSFRKFVLEPANEIAADLIHPVSGQTVGQLLDCLLNRKNVILFVGNADSRHAEIVRTSMPVNWSLEVVEAKKAFKEMTLKAKLVCFVEAESEINDTKRLAKSFPGPTLRLPRGIEKSKIEIEAAIEAMS